MKKGFVDVQALRLSFSAQSPWPLKALKIACLVVISSSVLCLPPADTAWGKDSVELDYSQMLKPLVDTSQKQQPNNFHDVTDTRLYGEAQHQGANTQANQGAPLVLSGKIQTLDAAIESERNFVDWYAWYLSVRAYLAQTGGLPCSLGTPIKFYRNGYIQALTTEWRCLQSTQHRMFPLPRNTRLDAVILPVRQRTAPPASPSELYSRIQEY